MYVGVLKGGLDCGLQRSVERGSRLGHKGVLKRCSWLGHKGVLKGVRGLQRSVEKGFVVRS